MDLTLLSLFERVEHPHRPMFYFYRDFKLQHALSSSELFREAEEFAYKFQSQVEPSEKVLMSLRNSKEFAACFMGLIMVGAIPVPVPTTEVMDERSRKPLVDAIQKATGARHLIDESFFKKVSEVDDSTPTKTFPRLSSEDVAMIQFSSGSTGAPKGVVLTHANLLANLEMICNGMKNSTQDILSSWLPFYHDMGLIGGFLSTLRAAGRGHFMNPTDFVASPKKWIESVSTTKTSIMVGPNLLYRQLVSRVPASFRKNLDLSAVRLSLCGAEMVSESVMDNFAQSYRDSGFKASSFFPVYGLAENTLAVTFPNLNEGMHVLGIDHQKMLQRKVQIKESSKIRVVGCGRPLPGVDLRIKGEDFCANYEKQSSTSIGEIEIRSPSLSTSYMVGPDRLTTTLKEGWFPTGDMGFLHEGVLYLTGRIKELIILNGKKHFPSDIEDQIHKELGQWIGRSAVVPLTSFARESLKAQGQLPQNLEGYAVVVERRSMFQSQKEKLRQKVFHLCTQFVQTSPDQVCIVPAGSLPRTSSGKTKRTEIANKVLSGEMAQADRFEFALSLVQKWREGSQGIRYLNGSWKSRWENWLGRYRNRNGSVVQNSNKNERQLREIIESFAAVVKIPPNHVDVRRPFAEYRIDSLALLELNAKLEEKAGDIPIEDFLGLKNIEDIHIYLRSKSGMSS